jgi:arabinose-5-phosphate isomerase
MEKMMFIQNSNLLVRDVMIAEDRVPSIEEKTILKEALEEMGRSKLGIVCIINSKKRLLGILTDGDIRRKLLKVQKPFSAFFVDDALDHAISTPSTIKPNDSLNYAVEVMEQKQIWDLPVIDGEGVLVGLLHLHPAVKAILNGKI